MKKYSIIKDEEGEIRVVPSNWLTDDKESVYWPPYKDSARVKSAAINLESRNSDWELYSCTFIKSNDDYVDAQKEARFPNLDDLTDASDEERLKATRAARNKITASPSKFISSFTKVKPPKTWETNNSVDGSKSTEGISPKKVLLAKNSVKNAPLLKSLQVDLQRTISPAQKSLFPRSEFLTGGPSGNSVVNDSSQEEEDGSNNEVELEITLPMIFEMQKTMVTKLNSLGIKVDNLSKKLQRCQNIRVADKEIVASQDMIESMSKIFPMTDEIPERSMDGVNEKIRTDPTFRKELSYTFGLQDGFNGDTLCGLLKSGLAQFLALEITKGNHRENRAIVRYLPWLFSPPSTVIQGSREFTDCVNHIRLLSWLLLGSLAHSLAITGNKVIQLNGSPIPASQPIPQEASCYVADHIQVIFSAFPDHYKSSIHNMSSIFYAFNVCQLWTLYLEEYSKRSNPDSEFHNVTMNILLEFWGKITPYILQLVLHSKMVADIVNLHFSNMLEVFLDCGCLIFHKLLPIWNLVLSSPNVQLSGHLFIRLQSYRNTPLLIRDERENVQDSRNIFHLSQWLNRLQFKMGQIEIQSSNMTQFYSF
ncbi:protein unc-79 homolog [Phymastichus coffea]|uniref:protein unc-79 homolog n=1 Tax=Phymastichus coffea TaxID=108790 RepID=UPI00273AD68D|nr:protein unc-79 homolog [Phymastichus coffea]